MGIEYPEFFDYDPVLGSRLRPGLQGYYRREGKGFVRINSDGFRGRDYPLTPPPNTLRIAVLGDSFTEAMQVNEDETFCGVLERELGRCPHLRGRKVEVLNFGQSGMGTARELLVLRHKVRKYSPHMVLLAFFTGNDVAENSPHINLRQYSYHPYFVLDSGRLILKDEEAKSTWKKVQQGRNVLVRIKHRVYDNLRLLQVLREGRNVLKTWGQKKAASGPGQEAGLHEAIYLEPRSPVWQEAWEITEALLRQLHAEVLAQHSRFFVVVLTNGIQVHPDPALRAAVAQRLGVPDLFYPDRRVENLCRREGIPVLLLAPVFQEIATQKQIFFHGFGNNLGSGHWNPAGHRLAGEIMAQWLCGQLAGEKGI